MKKLSLLIAASAMATCAFAATPVQVFFSSTGPDKYADGTDVLDGEIYAFVWVAEGAEFAGINYDGTLKDPVNNKIIRQYPAALGKRCRLCAFPLDNGDQDLVGSFYVYLFDTRVTTVTAEGQEVVEVAKKDADGKYVSLNAVERIEADIVKTEVNRVPAESALSGGNAVASALPEDVKNPVITSVDVVNGGVVVGVKDTVPYVRYAISAGESVTAIDKVLATGVNGTESGELTLTVTNPDKNRFFKVVRSK